MSAPLLPGTVLRQRYVIQQMLGQGGFGRTYLVLDQERFNDLCVLKEFTVPYQDATLIAKSKSLFQREASILYQIDHPQIPQFWASFEEDTRLFLVQSYIEGQTYRQCLIERQQQGRLFSVAEVVHLLSQMLPVLGYIHERDIIHRDITPENIILQLSETKTRRVVIPTLGLPVLIDFGSVKEAANHWFLASMTTRVGKVGYAPPEQLQTGMASPSSDLYALAATCLVLLTGKEPRKLLDGETLTWRWDACGHLPEELIAILSRMLAVYPGDRYYTASAVLEDLQPLLAFQVDKLELDPAIALPASSRTRAILPESFPLSEGDLATAKSLVASKPRPHYRPTRLRRWQWGGMAVALAVLGAAIPVIWRLLLPLPDSSEDVWVSGTRVPRSEASRIIESQTSHSRAALKPRSNSTESLAPQALQFSPNQVTTTVAGHLTSGQIQPYTLRASAGQIITVTLTGSDVAMNLNRSDQTPIDNAALQTRRWTGQIPTDDEYSIQVNGTGDYTLEVVMAPLVRPNQEQTGRITFTRGSHNTTVTGQLSPDQVRRYLLRAKQGQLLRLKLLEGQVKLDAIAPSGQRLTPVGRVQSEWQGTLPQEGDYVIELSTDRVGDYALVVEVY